MDVLTDVLKVAVLEAKVEERHRENQRWQAAMDEKVDGVAVDVKSLLNSRAFTRGMWKAVLTISAGVGAVAGAVVAWLRP